jgi:hypothetical protein
MTAEQMDRPTLQTVTIECRCWWPLRSTPYFICAEGARLPVVRGKEGRIWSQVQTLTFSWLSGDVWRVRFGLNSNTPVVSKNQRDVALGMPPRASKDYTMSFRCWLDEFRGMISFGGDFWSPELVDSSGRRLARISTKSRTIVLTCGEASLEMIPLLLCMVLYRGDRPGSNAGGG